MMMGRIRLSDKSRGWRLPRAVLNRFLHCAARYLPMFPAMRATLHRWRGVKVGKRVFIGSEVFIDDAEPDLVVIEDDVTIIARSCLLAHAFYPEHLHKYLAKATQRRAFIRQNLVRNSPTKPGGSGDHRPCRRWRAHLESAW